MTPFATVTVACLTLAGGENGAPKQVRGKRRSLEILWRMRELQHERPPLRLFPGRSLVGGVVVKSWRELGGDGTIFAD